MGDCVEIVKKNKVYRENGVCRIRPPPVSLLHLNGSLFRGPGVGWSVGGDLAKEEDGSVAAAVLLFSPFLVEVGEREATLIFPPPTLSRAGRAPPFIGVGSLLREWRISKREISPSSSSSSTAVEEKRAEMVILGGASWKRGDSDTHFKSKPRCRKRLPLSLEFE